VVGVKWLRLSLRLLLGNAALVAVVLAIAC
jgi:hypothetical protein